MPYKQTAFELVCNRNSVRRLGEETVGYQNSTLKLVVANSFKTTSPNNGKGGTEMPTILHIDIIYRS